MPVLRLVLAMAAVAPIGCGEMARPGSEYAAGEAAESLAVGMAPAASPSTEAPWSQDQIPADAVAPAPEAPPERKIIYNAQVDLAVEDFEAASARLVELVESTGGYLADSEVLGSPRSPRSGTWKVRVPVERFDGFLDDLAGLGELRRRKMDSREVSEEYYDLDARLRNKRREEQRLVELLDEQSGGLEHVLNVEKELSRVREEIERFQGRLRLLTDLTTLSTVTVTLEELRDYAPPTAPSFGTRIARTFAASAGSLREFGEGIVLAAVAVALWLPLLLAGAGLIWWAVRRAMKARERRRA